MKVTCTVVLLGVIGSASAFVVSRQVSAPSISTALFSAEARARNERKKQNEKKTDKFIRKEIKQFDTTGDVELETFRSGADLEPLFLEEQPVAAPKTASGTTSASEPGQEETILKVIENQLIGTIFY